MNRLVLILCLLPASNPILAKNLFLLAYGDDKEGQPIHDSRGEDRKKDIERMNSIWFQYAKHAGFNYRPILNYSSGFSSEKLRKDIEGLKIEDGDILIFYYTGHGINAGKYPKLIFKPYGKKNKDPGIELVQVDSLLRMRYASKKPSNILLIADCCNATDNAQVGTKGAQDVTLDSNALKRLKTAIRNSANIKYLICTAEKGDMAWSYTNCANGDCGSFWNLSFRDAIISSDNYDNLNALFKNVDNRIENRCSNKTRRQVPVANSQYLNGKIKLTIECHLSNNQVFENISITLNGNTKKRMLNQSRKSSTIDFEIPPGEVSYQINVETETKKDKRKLSGRRSKTTIFTHDQTFTIKYSSNLKMDRIDEETLYLKPIN